MIEIQKDNHQNNIEDGIELMELFHILFNKKWIIFSITAFTSIAGIIYSLSLPNIYESRAILAPVDSSNSISSALRSYSGIAGLAGINIAQGSDEGNSKKAIQKLNSLSFFENNIIRNIFLPNLMAVKSWDSKTNSVVYDKNIYIKESNTWKRETSEFKTQIPSSQESFKAFQAKHLNISEDISTGFLTLSIKHQSPVIAKKWAELMINEVNSFYRKKDKLASEKAVSYLNQQISGTALSEIKIVMAELLQEETKKLTLIEANEYYVFDYIDPPAIMEQKSGPNRLLICVTFALFGGILSILLVFIQHYFFKRTFVGIK